MGHSKKLEYTALIGLVLQLIFAGTCMIVANQSGSRAAYAEMWQLVIGVLVWFVVLIHGRQRRLALEEQEEMARLKESRLSEEIFEETELDSMRASSGLRVLERYLVPLFTLVLSGLLLFFGWYIVSGAWGKAALPVTRPSMVAIAAIFIAFPGFLIGRYAAGLAQSEGFGLLRAAGGYVLGNVIGLILIAIAMALLYFDVTWAEVAVTYIIPVIMALVGIELVLNLILDIYRPRVPGRERRPPYESRLLVLFAEPQGVLKTVATTLDYQFGFKVSETWFYHFMERAILPLLIVQVMSLWLLTMIVVVNPDEVAFVEVLSKPYLTQTDKDRGLYATVLEPGFHWKWPWPFGVARHVPAYEIQSIAVGKIYKEGMEGLTDLNLEDVDDVSLWKESHIPTIRGEPIGEEASFLVPSTAKVNLESAPVGSAPVGGAPVGVAPVEGAAAEGAAKTSRAPEVNLARLLAHVHFRVKQKPDGTIDEQSAFTYTFRQADIERHMEELSYRALCRIAASQDFLRWIAEDRELTVARLKQMITEAADRENLGLEVVFVGLTAVHPPQETAAAYENVVKNMEGKEYQIYQGKDQSVQMVWDAKARAEEVKDAANGASEAMRQRAEASKKQFLAQLDAYTRSPLVYEYRSYFDTLEDMLKAPAPPPGTTNQPSAPVRLYVVPKGTDEIDIIDMQVKYTSQILTLPEK